MESCEELSSISTLMLIGGAVLTLGVVSVVGVDVDSVICVSVVPSCVCSESSFSFCFLERKISTCSEYNCRFIIYNLCKCLLGHLRLIGLYNYIL